MQVIHDKMKDAMAKKLYKFCMEISPFFYVLGCCSSLYFQDRRTKRKSQQNSRKQVQPVAHKLTQEVVVLKIINLTRRNGREIPISDLTEKERRNMVNNANREALAGRSYIEEKTA